MLGLVFVNNREETQLILLDVVTLNVFVTCQPDGHSELETTGQSEDSNEFE